MKKEYRLIISGDRVKQFKTIGDNKIFVDTINDWRPSLVSRFTDEKGKRKVLRFLAESDDVEMDKQIANNFPANTKIGQEDRDELTFKKGILITEKANVILYLDSIPENKSFRGDRGATQPQFEEYIASVQSKKNVSLGLMQAKAILFVNKMTDDELENKLLKINGSTYEIPETREDKIEAMYAIVSDIDEEKSEIFEIIGEDTKEDVVTLVGRAINAKVLSFINKPNNIQLKRNGEWKDVWPVSDQHTEQQKQDMFLDRLNTTEGAAMVVAIQEALKNEKHFSKVVEKGQPEEKSISDEELKKMFEERFSKKEESKKDEQVKVKQVSKT